MIIDDHNKIVFQHTPKCGGTYIQEQMVKFIPTCYTLLPHGIQWYLKEDEQQWYWDRRQHFGLLGHMEFRKLKNDIIENYVLWINIRHPISLWISMYIEMEYKHLVWPKAKLKPNPLSFEEFMIMSTDNFNIITSQSHKIKNAIEHASRNKGCRILQQETLPIDMLMAFDSIPIKITYNMIESVLTTERRVTDKDKAQELKYQILNNSDLCKKILQYEYYLTDRFYPIGDKIPCE